MLRIRAKTDYDPVTTVRSYGDRDQRLDYDKNIEDCCAVRWVGCNLFESMQLTKSSLGVINARDFYQYFLTKISKDHSVVKMVGRDNTDRPPTRKDCVRMRLPMCGTTLTRDPSNPRHTIIN